MDMNFNSGRVFCTKCGTANKAGYRFCVKCGTKLMTPVARPQPEDVQELPKMEPVKVEPQPEMAELQPTFRAFEQEAPAAEPVKAEPEPEMPELQSTFRAFEQEVPAAEPVKLEPEMAELQPTFSVFEQEAPAAEPEMPTFSAFEQTAPQEEPVQTAGFARDSQAAFEAEPKREFTGFARSGFTGATTPTAAAGAFATAVEAVKNNKQIDVSDAETVMSLLEQGESSALAKGLPAWDIVPPQVVVRRKHRV